MAWLLADAAHQTGRSFRWVIHSAMIIETTDEALGDLREAESGQRGFVLTHDLSYARTFDERINSAAANMARVVALTTDNPVQHARARAIARLMAERTIALGRPLKLGRAGDFAGARAFIASGRGRELMDAITVRTQSFLDEERALQTVRVEAAERRLARSQRLSLAGASTLAILLLLACALLIRGIRRPLAAMMQAMTELGRGQKARIAEGMGSREFTLLARGYNAMADRLELAVAKQATSEQRLQVANIDLQNQGEALRERNDVIELLGGMAHRMQAARTDEELAQIIRVFVPRVLPDLAGALYAHNNSRNLLVPVAYWGGLTLSPDGFPPDACWALRRGRSHCVLEPGADIVCGHASGEELYHCEPLLAGGEVIGVLHLRGRVPRESRFRLTVLTENIASALVNHRLQRSLREQTIRDPLTGLFNRRYMEEALALEIARASRSGQPLSLVMCDVDHFKRFNDEFGHDAGDAVLQAVSAEMRNRFRDGDVVCRYGGEEFTIIAPGTDATALLNRVEQVRLAIAELNIRAGGQRLGATSMSFGIATWTDAMDRDGTTLIKAADAALYDAKRAGRNRAKVSLVEAQRVAA
ncbi:diguanylate cyclase [Sphingomonas abaci]|uniref:diguanylate cyclase n=1 Tax=Sphingomonas abaci TaxID=237611 RepID=A0A7W7AFC7_9SPHN|nr:diguanylate cyclase [Sphingomonas abaci]MBB4616012.1 diguanylate cyclase (GGDEF)-like protein [Sphingomonas abaci]